MILPETLVRRRSIEAMPLVICFRSPRRAVPVDASCRCNSDGSDSISEYEPEALHDLQKVPRAPTRISFFPNLFSNSVTSAGSESSNWSLDKCCLFKYFFRDSFVVVASRFEEIL